MDPEVPDGVLAAAYEWTKSGRSIQRSTSWTTEGAMDMVAGRAAVKEIEESSARMPSGFPMDVEQPPHSVADVVRSQFKTAWRETMKIKLDGHNTTCTYQAATLPRGRKTVGVK